MTQWAHSLIRISNYEVETLQKRLTEIGERKSAAEMRVVMLDAEREAETENARHDVSAAALLRAYLGGWEQRRDQAVSNVRLIGVEEEGARDALMSAFEELKKFEHVAEVTRLERVAAANKREAAQMDEQAIRRAAGGR
jgi:flagellar protein FliJ